MKKVFLGGTCNNSTWRDVLIPKLKIEYFNPVITGDLTSDHQVEEIRQRGECDYCLYVITPKMTGMYSIAEVVEDAILRSEKTIFVVIERDIPNVIQFTEYQSRSLFMVRKMIEKHSKHKVFHFDSDDALPILADYLNSLSD